MDTAWIAPPVVLLAGAFGVVALLRRIAEASSDLVTSQRRMRRLEDGLIPVRVETRRARRSVDRYQR